jgi:hypothetical protein
MSSHPNGKLPTSGPEPGDCFRLFRTLQREYIPGLRVEVNWYEFGNHLYGMKLELLDDSAMTLDGGQLVNVWAMKTFGNQLHLISDAQLYDLLIVGYRAIERFFEQGEAAAPVRRAK